MSSSSTPTDAKLQPQTNQQIPPLSVTTSVQFVDATPLINSLQKENAELKKENAELKKNNHELQTLLLDYASRIDQIQKSSNVLDERLLILEKENQLLRLENLELKKQNEAFKDAISSLTESVKELKKEKDERIQNGILGELAFQLETAMVTKSVEGTEYEDTIYKFGELFRVIKDDETVSKNFTKICKDIGYDTKKHKKAMLSLKDLRLSAAHPNKYNGVKIDVSIIKNIAKESDNSKIIGELCDMLAHIRNEGDLFLVDF
jgi:cell division septum initiation protein DivIVA